MQKLFNRHEYVQDKKLMNKKVEKFTNDILINNIPPYSLFTYTLDEDMLKHVTATTKQQTWVP